MKKIATGQMAQMVSECYDEYKKGNIEHIPKGMNETSAKLTMVWLKCLFTGKPIHFNGGVLQCKLTLELIRNDYGEEAFTKAKSVLLEYCESAQIKYNKPCISLRKLLLDET